MKPNEALQPLGLNEKEASVYIALLQLGRASAYSISDKSGLKKPTTYVILDELIKKGFVARVPKVRKQLYVAEPPEQAFAIAEEKLKKAKEKLPELIAYSRNEEKKVNVMYFEGVKGIKQMVEYKMKENSGKELLGFYVTDNAFSPDTRIEFENYFKNEWNEKMLKLGITMRGIVPDHKSMAPYRETDEKYGRKVKKMPVETYYPEAAIDLIGNIVRIQDYKNTQGVLLENSSIAKTLRQIFEMVWKKN